MTATKIEHSHWSQSTSRIGYKKSNEFMSSLVCWSMHKPWMYRTDVDVKTTPKPWFCGLGKSLIPGQWKQIWFLIRTHCWEIIDINLQMCRHIERSSVTNLSLSNNYIFCNAYFHFGYINPNQIGICTLKQCIKKVLLINRHIPTLKNSIPKDCSHLIWR